MGREDDEPELDITSETIEDDPNAPTTSQHLSNAQKSLQDKNNDLQKKNDELGDAISKLQSQQDLSENDKQKLRDEVNDLQSSIDKLSDEISILESYTEDTQHSGDFVDTSTFFTRQENLTAQKQRYIDSGDMTEEIADMWYRQEMATETGMSGGMTGSRDDIYVPREFFNRMKQARQGRLDFINEQITQENAKDTPNQNRLNALNDLQKEAKTEAEEMYGTFDTPQKYYPTDTDLQGNTIPTNTSRRGRDSGASPSKEEQELHDELQKSQDAQTEAEGQVGVLQNQLKSKQDALDALQKQFDDLQANDVDDEVVKQNLKDQIDDLQAQITQDQATISSQTSQISQLQQEKANLQSQLTSAQQEGTADDAQISQLKAQIAQKDAQIKQEQDLEAQKDTQISDIKGQLATAQQGLANYRKDIRDRLGLDENMSNADVDAYITQYLALDEQHKATIAEQEQKIADLQRQLDGEAQYAGGTEADKDGDKIPDDIEDDIPKAEEGMSWGDAIDYDKNLMDELAKINAQGKSQNDDIQQNPNLYTGKENTPDPSFFKHILDELSGVVKERFKQRFMTLQGHALTSMEESMRISWNAFILKYPKLAIPLWVAKKMGFEDDLKNVAGGIGGLMKNAFDYAVNHKEPLRIHLKNELLEEEKLISKRYLIPFVVISFYLYFASFDDKIEKTDMSWFETIALRYILKNYLRQEDNRIKYFEYCIKEFPQELIDRFRKNLNTIQVEISLDEGLNIFNYIKKIEDEYKRLFKADLKDDLKSYEQNKGFFLYDVLKGLNKPSVLHEIGQVITGVNRLSGMFIEDKGLLMGLLGLLFATLNEDDFTTEMNLMNANIEGVVYYKKTRQNNIKRGKSVIQNILEATQKGQGKRDLEGIELLEDSKDVALYKKGDTYYISIQGTDHHKIEDIRQNFLNLGGSTELFTNEKYNARFVNSMEYTLKSIQEIMRGKGKNIRILGYSLGGISALLLSTYFPDIQVDVYNPIMIKTPLMEGIMRRANNSKVKIHYVEEDPISNNVKYFSKYVNTKKYRKNKYFTPHKVQNFAF